MPDRNPSTIDEWSPEQCISFLEIDGSVAPEYDLETDHGLDRLRADCREKAAESAAAA